MTEQTTEKYWPKTEEELITFIRSRTTEIKYENDEDGYNVSANALWETALSTFNYVASYLGCTGFQASCADLRFLRHTRHIKGPFYLVSGEKLLYPQHDLLGDVAKSLDKWRKEWCPDVALKKLANESNGAHPRVLAHWFSLAEQKYTLITCGSKGKTTYEVLTDELDDKGEWIWMDIVEFVKTLPEEE